MNLMRSGDTDILLFDLKIMLLITFGNWNICTKLELSKTFHSSVKYSVPAAVVVRTFFLQFHPTSEIPLVGRCFAGREIKNLEFRISITIARPLPYCV